MQNWPGRHFAGWHTERAHAPAERAHAADARWIDSLPIAAAVYRLDAGEAQIVIGNTAFQRLATMIDGLESSGGAWLATLLERVAHDGRTYEHRWESDDPVFRRRLDITIAPYRDEEAAAPLFLVSLVDRTAEAETLANLRREMLSDNLTGLPNRTGFEEEIERRVAAFHASAPAGEDREFAVLAIDLARFSQVNQCSGSIVGDELLITVASRLKSLLRRHDMVARIGGNEFGMFLVTRNSDIEVPAIAKRVEAVFKDPFKLSGLEISMEVAIGAAIGHYSQSNPSDTIRHAQVALKRAKVNHDFRLYTPEALQQVRRRFSLETDLRKAIERDALELDFQPLIDLESGEVAGFEALARWRDADRGIIPPTEFIPVAEECGLIVPLGRWALDHAARTLANWDARAGSILPVKVNVNLSAIQFARDDVPTTVEQALRNAGIDGRRLTLELTESAIFSDPDRARRILEKLKNLDTTLAMDDFGTGYSNLASLQMLPIDVLKIDRSFVTQMLEDSDKVSIVRAVLSLAGSLGMETTAEGIETLALSERLAALGCTTGQGYYFAKPLSPDQAFDFYQDWVARGIVEPH